MPRFLHLPMLSGFGAAYLSGRVGSIISRERSTFALSDDAVPAGASVVADLGDLADFTPRIQAAAASVGKIELRIGGEWQVVATCFRIGNDAHRIATAGHVVAVLLQESARIEPGYRPEIKAARPERRELRAHRVVFEKTAFPRDATESAAEVESEIEKIELVHGEHDLMLALLKDPCPRRALPLAAPAPAGSGFRACVIGYPVRAPATGEDKTNFEALFALDGQVKVGVKRASPGVIDNLRHPPQCEFPQARHDATTLPGSSGSPVISLEDGGVIGLHTQGRQGGDRNLLIYLPAVVLEDALRARLDRDHHGQEADFPAWPDASLIRGRTLGSGETADDGLELASPRSPTLPSAAPGRYACSPAVMTDRRDMRDRYYRPSLRKPRACVPAPKLDDDRILRQGYVADCTGCALAAAIDIALAKQGRGTRASARMLYEMARVHDEFVDDEPQGSSLRGAIKGFYHNGACPASDADAEADWYLSVDRAKEARCISLGAYYRLRPSLPDFQMAIQEAGAVLVSAWTHSGWTNPRGGRIPHRRDRHGAHAFVLVGYDAEGFLVQNSWGADWGRFAGRPGTAHWKYADWAETVIDAWVLQTAPSAPAAHNLPLRSYQPGTDPTVTALPPEITALPEPRRLAVVGHVAHAERAGLVDAGRIGVGLRALRESAMYLARREVWERPESRDPESPTAYRGIAFIFHDPMLGAEAVARLSGHLVPRFKAAGVYPMNILYGADEIRSLMARVSEEAAFASSLAGPVPEDLTAFIERRARTIGASMLQAFLAGIEEAAEPGGALWQIIASFGCEAVLPPAGVEAEPRRMHLLAFGAGALVAAAAFRDPAATQLGAGDGAPAPMLLHTVALVGPVPPAPGKQAPWGLINGRKPFVVRLGPTRPAGKVLAGYRGDWSDLLSSMMSGGSGVRDLHGRATGPDTLSALALDRTVLNAIMREVTGRRLSVWESF